MLWKAVSAPLGKNAAIYRNTAFYPY